MLKASVISICLIASAAIGSNVAVTHDGGYVEISVPSTWKNVTIETDPDGNFQEYSHTTESVVYKGRTTAVNGIIHATECEGGFCRLVQEEFTISQAGLPFHWLAGSAFLCGFLMLFMPCTLPAIGLKLAAFKGGSETPYAAGVILSFTILGILAAFLGAGLSHMSHWYYRAILTVVCYTVGLQFIGWLSLPGFGTSTRSPFFLGVLSVALGSSCTVPFIAPILVASSILPPWQTILLFQIVGLGFVSPFLLPIHKMLPKPGAWMVTYERVCGVMMLIIAAWLFSTLSPPESNSVSYPASGPRVIIVTGDFCLNCKIVHHHWNDPFVLSALKAQDIQPVTLDWTNGNEEVTNLLARHKVKAIPFVLIENVDGRLTILSGLYGVQDILDALAL